VDGGQHNLHPALRRLDCGLGNGASYSTTRADGRDPCSATTPTSP
jgi:hypothetical protein